jgi:regulator of sigma D
MVLFIEIKPRRDYVVHVNNSHLQYRVIAVVSPVPLRGFDDMNNKKNVNLIAEFKAEHREILKGFRAVYGLDVDSEEGRKALGKVRDVLLKHHEKEHLLIYQQLQDHSGNSPYSNRGYLKNDIIRSFHVNIDEVIDMVDDYYKRLNENRVNGSSRSAEELMRLVSIVADRFELEETVIFMMYEKLSAKIPDSSAQKELRRWK